MNIMDTGWECLKRAEGTPAAMPSQERPVYQMPVTGNTWRHSYVSSYYLGVLEPEITDAGLENTEGAKHN